MKKNVIGILLAAAALGLGVISWFLLPDVVAVQVGLDGQVTNTMPKALAVVIPSGITVAGAVMNLTGKDEKNTKGLLLSAAGIAVLVLSLLMNR